MVDSEKIRWCITNGELGDLKDQMKNSGLHIDDPALTEKRPAIIYAADYGQTEIIQYFIEKGANVNVEDQYGITPLLAAIWENHPETVKLLLKNGADKNKLSPGQISYRDEAPNDAIKGLLDKY